ncbi:RagB/SusD family nutrient uptake outer membrane protein [Flavisolibacter sp. BT320]|nr:RagB/SusD family nutrient uptake outer membrane protein [Flavisolibacter longurius]
MKRISIHAIYLVTAITLLAVSSCRKILDQEPKNSTYADAFWKNGRDFRSAMAGNYSLVRAAFFGPNSNDSWSYNGGKIYYYMYGDAMAKNYFTIQYSGDRGGGDGLESIQNGDFTGSYNYNSLGNWTKHYKSIAMSNLIIEKATAASSEIFSDEEDAEKFRKNILGQAYFLRGLSYFVMTRVWGDVPLVTTTYEDPLTAPQLPRSPKTEVYAQIEKDAQMAASLLNWGYENAGDWGVIANKGSAYALLAHFYLWRGTMKNVNSSQPDMQDINSADTAINRIMTMGGYTLTDTSRYYNTFIGKSTEGIFELAASEDNLEGSAGHIGMSFLRGDYVEYFGSNPRFFVPQAYLTKHFKISGEFIPAHWWWDGTQWVWLPDENKTIMDSTDIRFRKNFDYVKQDRPSSIKYSNVTYRSPNKREPYLSNNMVIFRLADIMLLKAEVELYRNNPDAAVDIINFFRIRNGAHIKDPNDPNDKDLILAHGLSKQEVMEQYILERGKELFLEGHIFYDLLRTREYKNNVDWLPSDEIRFKREGFYLPVDPLLFRYNPSLKQTPYWIGKV